jgi:3-oxoadipate enol-lactonase
MKSVKLFYKEFGNGQPIIFLHGYPLDHSIWMPLIPLLETNARLIMPDLRGHGQSPAPNGVYSMELLSADILSLMNDLKIEKAILAGHSMGGYVALAFARDHPDRLAGLALVASHCYADPSDRLQARLDTADRVEKTGSILFIAENMLPNLTSNMEIQNKLKPIIENTKPAGVVGVLRGIARRKDTSDVLVNIDVPAVIIAGEEDRIIPIDRMRQMANLMKKPWLEIIPHAGHMPMMEKPKGLSLVLLTLLESI